MSQVAPKFLPTLQGIVTTLATSIANGDTIMVAFGKLQAQINGLTGGSIPQVTTDPVSPAAQSAWVLRTPGLVDGNPVGLLLSITSPATPDIYRFSYRTNEGTTVRVRMT